MAVTLNASKREDLKQASLRQLRTEGKFPAVVYGNNVENTPVAIDEADFLKALRENGRNGIISLAMGDQKSNVILSEYQQDCLKGHMIHADFLAIKMDQEIDVEVRIDFVGESKGVKEGGVLQQSLHTVAVKARADELPEVIEYDISDLEIGDAISVADLKKTVNFTITAKDEEVVGSILPPVVASDEEAGEEPEGETGEEA